MKRCKVCRVNPPIAKERCDTCYRFWKRTGRDRTNATEKQVRANENWRPSRLRRLERLLHNR